MSNFLTAGFDKKELSFNGFIDERYIIGRNDIRNVQRGYLNDVPLYIFPPDVIDGAENQIEISESIPFVR